MGNLCSRRRDVKDIEEEPLLYDWAVQESWEKETEMYDPNDGFRWFYERMLPAQDEDEEEEEPSAGSWQYQVEAEDEEEAPSAGSWQYQVESSSSQTTLRAAVSSGSWQLQVEEEEEEEGEQAVAQGQEEQGAADEEEKQEEQQEDEEAEAMEEQTPRAPRYATPNFSYSSFLLAPTASVGSIGSLFDGPPVTEDIDMSSME